MFSAFIDELGVKPLALVFGVSVFTIYSWKRRNRIPRDRWDRLMEFYPRVTYRRLVDMDHASRTHAALTQAA